MVFKESKYIKNIVLHRIELLKKSRPRYSFVKLYLILTFYAIRYFHLLQNLSLQLFGVAQVQAFLLQVSHDLLLQLSDNVAGVDYTKVKKHVLLN